MGNKFVKPKSDKNAPSTNTVAGMMYEKYGVKSCTQLALWYKWTKQDAHPFPRWGSLRAEIIDNLSCRLEQRTSDKLGPEPDLEACKLWEDEALQVSEVARDLIKRKLLKLETQVKGLPQQGIEIAPAPVTAVQGREAQGSNAGDPSAYVNNTPSLYPNLGGMGLLATASAFPVQEITPAGPGGVQAQSVYRPFKEIELRSMKERVLDQGRNAGAIKGLITQWVEAHRCTHHDIGVLCQAVLSPYVWKKARESAEWTANELAGCTDADRQINRQRLYDGIETALRPPALDWDKIYETKQRQGERASEFMDRLMQTLLQYGGFQVEADIPQRTLTNFVMEGLRPQIRKQLKYVLLGWQAKEAKEICIAADHCLDRAEERENAKTKIKDEVLQMVLLDKATEKRSDKDWRKWGLEEDDTDSEEDGARQWGRLGRVLQRPPLAAQDERPKKGKGRNKGWTQAPPQTRSRTAAGQGQIQPTAPQECFQCGQLGHWKRNCPQRRRSGFQQQGGSNQPQDGRSY